MCDPIVKEELLSKYILFTVKGSDKEGPYEVLRRYSHFAMLREALVKRWPGCYVPPVPPKQSMGNMNLKFVEHRRLHLEEFCVAIAKIEHLYYSEEF